MLGLDAYPAVREGLAHQSADVRYWCCQFLDHFLTSEVMDELVAMLNDVDDRVRCSALHSLAYDRCKEGSCSPEEGKVLPQAIALLVSDPDPMSAPAPSDWWDVGFTPIATPRPRFCKQ